MQAMLILGMAIMIDPPRFPVQSNMQLEDPLKLGLLGNCVRPLAFFFFFMNLGLELSDTEVFEPQIRALLGIAAHYCEAVVLQSRTVPSGTALAFPSSRPCMLLPSGVRVRAHHSAATMKKNQEVAGVVEGSGN